MEEVLNEAKEEDVLKEINDTYIRNKKRKNVIIFSIIAAFVLAISAIVIAFSTVKVNTKPTTLAEPTKFTITLSNDTISLDPTDEKYDEFYALYQNAFETTYMTALFTNSLKGYEITETSNNFYSSYSGGVGIGRSTNLANSLGSEYVHMYYAAEQTLHYANGDVYYSKRNTENYALNFVDVYFPLSSANQFGDFTFYVGTYGYSKTPRITTITVKANTAKLTEFVKSL